MAGDDRSILESLYASLRRFAAVVAAAEMDPDDLVQEAMARLLRRGGVAEVGDPGAYLRRSILNLAANDRRSAGRRRRALSRLFSRDDGTVRPAYPSDVADLQRLPPDIRAVLYLSEVEGWRFREIADLLGCSEEAARTRASRGRRRLVEELAWEGDT